MSLLRFNPIITFNQLEIDALIIAGIPTVQVFMVREAASISKATSIDIRKIKANQSKLYGHYSSPLVNFSNLWEEKSEKISIYSTGCTKLDAMIDGGIYSGEITSVTGPSCAGKTQFALHMALRLAIQGKETIYIDTDGSFSAERLAQMYDEIPIKKDKESVLSKIHIIQIFGLYSLLPSLERLTQELTKNPQNELESTPSSQLRASQRESRFPKEVSLIILDSYTNPFVDVLDYQDGWNKEKKRSFLSISSAYNQALRSIVIKRPDVAMITTNLPLEFAKCLWYNNCGLVLSFDSVEEDIKEISCVQCERITTSYTNCQVKITKLGLVDHIPEESLYDLDALFSQDYYGLSSQ